MNTKISTLKIRNAEPGDTTGIYELLQVWKLPTEGVTNNLSNFLIAETDGKIAGTIGLELYDDHALLRSAAVHPDYQNKGIGNRLVHMITEYAKEKGAKDITLLTTTAQEYFAKKGFISIERNSVKGKILSSHEFKGGCPSTAICMRKEL